MRFTNLVTGYHGRFQKIGFKYTVRLKSIIEERTSKLHYINKGGFVVLRSNKSYSVFLKNFYRSSVIV